MDTADESSEIVFTESSGAFSPVKKFKWCSRNNELVEIFDTRKESSSSATTMTASTSSPRPPRNDQGSKLLMFLRLVFLPHGYPDSVSSDYSPYQFWDTVQAFCSSITGALATEAVMKGVGVGDELATPLAAALTWLIKRGSGMIAQIMFAGLQGTALDYDCKKWRLFADVVNDIAIFIDLMVPLFPHRMVMFVLCGSSVARALVGVAGSATRAAITQHQARSNNMADVSAKDGSQETLVNLVALVVSLILLPTVSGKIWLVWSLYCVFTSLHLFANFRAVKSLRLEAFNAARLKYCITGFVQNGQVPSVDEANAGESVCVLSSFFSSSQNLTNIKAGMSLSEMYKTLQKTGPESCASLLGSSHGKPFLIVDTSFASNKNSESFNIIFHEKATSKDALEAFGRCFILSALVHSKKSTESKDVFHESVDKVLTEFIFEAFKTGYVTDHALLNMGDWKCSWNLKNA